MPVIADIDLPQEIHEQKPPAIVSVVANVVFAFAVAGSAVVVIRSSEAESAPALSVHHLAACMLLLLAGLAYGISFCLIAAAHDTVITSSLRRYVAPLKVIATRRGRLPRLDLGVFRHDQQ